MSAASARRGTLQDLDAIVRLERAASEAPHWKAEVYRRILENEENEAIDAAGMLRRAVFVAEADGSPAGFAVGAVVAGEVELESVAVAGRMRRRGVGELLCREVLQWGREASARMARLEVRASNAGAQALYRKLGFEPTGLRRGYYANPVEDAVTMARSLQPSDL